MAVDMEITLDELLKACREAGFDGSEQAPGKTTAELAEMWGCSKAKARNIIERANKVGLVRIGRRKEQRIDGVFHYPPVYSFVFDDRAKKGKRKP